MRKKKLAWGHTPWDNLSCEELLREVQRMYAALESLKGVVAQSRYFEEQTRGQLSPFWGKEGLGGRAWEMTRQVLEPIEKAYDSESLYRSFYRYAHDVLFDQSEMLIGFGWTVCPECGVMLGTSTNGHSHEGETCLSVGLNNKPDCKGVFRKLEWDDLKPNKRKK